MDAFAILVANNGLVIAYAALIGLAVGSFLNVVIYRLPVMMEKSWRQECREFLELDPPIETVEPQFDLIVPRSRCPHCGHLIRAHENIPVLSYLWLRGRCSQCHQAISMRYPLIELLTALVSAMVAWKFGPSWQTVFGLGLSWCLIALAVIDLDHRLLPDSITLPVLWLGLFISLFGVFADSRASIIGAIAGYMSLWLVYHGYRLLTGKQGMGYGDFKLLALFGAWLGWRNLPLIVLLSSLLGALLGLSMIVWRKRDRAEPIPFGPFLAGAGWIALLWGQDLTAYYFQLAGIH